MTNEILQNPQAEKQAGRDIKKQQRAAALQMPSGQETPEQYKQQMASQQKAAMAKIRGGDEKSYQRNLRAEQRKSAQQEKPQGKLSQIKEAVKDVIKKGVQKLTAQALRFSWLNLISSLGFTVFYINFHLFGKYIASSDYFSEFGEEWMPSTPGGGQMPGQEIGKTGLKWGEIIALLALDGLIAIIIGIGIIAVLGPIMVVFSELLIFWKYWIGIVTFGLI